MFKANEIWHVLSMLPVRSTAQTEYRSQSSTSTNGFIKNIQEILLDLANFALQEQREYNLMFQLLIMDILMDIKWKHDRQTGINERYCY